MHFTTDNESSLANVLKAHGVSHLQVDPGDKTIVGIIERFNKTLRELIDSYMKANKTKNWVDVHEQLIENYNTSRHSTIKVAPNEYATLPPEAKQAIISARKAKSAPAIAQLLEFKPGDKVRVLRAKDVFAKGSPVFTKKTYTIERVDGLALILRDDNGTLMKRRYKNWQVKPIEELAHPVEVTSAEVALTEDTPVEVAPVEAAPAEVAPTEEAPVEKPAKKEQVAPLMVREKNLDKFVRRQAREGILVDKTTGKFSIHPRLLPAKNKRRI
jgi:hypothetical protein